MKTKLTFFTSSSIPIDYNLYRKFWTLQDYFRNPVQCYDKVSWITFVKVKCRNINSTVFSALET